MDDFCIYVDCFRSAIISGQSDQDSFAHKGGVNVALADGSVRLRPLQSARSVLNQMKVHRISQRILDQIETLVQFTLGDWTTQAKP